MRISVQANVVIERPIEEVFAFVSDLENSPSWGRTEKSTKAKKGPITVGTVFREEVKVMGRSTNSRAQVTDYDRPARFSYTSYHETGWEEKAIFAFEQVGEGTRTSFAGEAEMGRLAALFSPIFSWMMSRQLKSLLRNIKKVLEAPDAPAS